LPDLIVRLAAIDEAADIAAVLRDAFEAYRPLYTPAAFAATTPPADGVRQRWHEGPVWVALQGERIVGTAAAVPRVDALYMRSMAVSPASRGAGCGRRLLEAMERHAAAHGFVTVVLSTTPFLDPAIALYERCGFRRTDAGPLDLAGTPLFTMEKILEWNR
jgi:ribosomal protein S18 acetylase RimI-like enzyme